MSETEMRPTQGQVAEPKKPKYVCSVCGGLLEQQMPFTKYFALLGGGIDMLFPRFWCKKCNKRVPICQLPPEARKEVRVIQLIGVGLIVVCLVVMGFLIDAAER